MTEDILHDVQLAFPDIEFRVIQKRDCFHSTVYRLAAGNPSPGFPHEVIVKKYRDTTTFDAQGEYYYLDKFYSLNNDTVVSSPVPVMMDAERQFIIIGFIPGHTVKTHLLTIIPDRINTVNDYIDKSALALARFHTVFARPEDTECSVNSPLLCRFGEGEREQFTALVSDCALRTKAQAYIDFSPQNLIIHDDRIFLIDFPDRECICTPHLDIARWKFNLLFMKQLPRSRFLRLNTWDEDLVFQRFVDKYCSEMHGTLEENDVLLIDFFLAGYAKKLESIYRQSDTLRLKLEYRYLSGFLRSLTGRRPRGQP